MICVQATCMLDCSDCTEIRKLAGAISVTSFMSHRTTIPTKWFVRPAKTPISLGIHPVWSKSSLSAWRKLRCFATHWAHSEDSDRTSLGAQSFCWFCHEAALIFKYIYHHMRHEITIVKHQLLSVNMFYLSRKLVELRYFRRFHKCSKQKRTIDSKWC